METETTTRTAQEWAAAEGLAPRAIPGEDLRAVAQRLVHQHQRHGAQVVVGHAEGQGRVLRGGLDDLLGHGAQGLDAGQCSGAGFGFFGQV